MGKISHKEKTFEQRLKESSEILTKYPDRICVYIEKTDKCKTLPELAKKKYLIPKNITAAQFILIIRNKIEIAKESALIFYVNNSIMTGSATMSVINDEHCAPDGFLYIKYAGETCFG